MRTSQLKVSARLALLAASILLASRQLLNVQAADNHSASATRLDETTQLLLRSALNDSQQSSNSSSSSSSSASQLGEAAATTTTSTTTDAVQPERRHSSAAQSQVSDRRESYAISGHPRLSFSAPEFFWSLSAANKTKKKKKKTNEMKKKKPQDRCRPNGTRSEMLRGL